MAGLPQATRGILDGIRKFSQHYIPIRNLYHRPLPPAPDTSTPFEEHRLVGFVRDSVFTKFNNMKINPLLPPTQNKPKDSLGQIDATDPKLRKNRSKI